MRVVHAFSLDSESLQVSELILGALDAILVQVFIPWEFIFLLWFPMVFHALLLALIFHV